MNVCMIKGWTSVDHLQKDKSCLQKGDFIPYPAEGGPWSKEIPLKSVTPKGIFTVTVFVKCKGQAKDQYCHIENPKTARSKTPTYFATEAMNSRPKNLYAAVIISSLIGPVLLLAFLIWERGVLAKQA
jgi:hypothetical protein